MNMVRVRFAPSPTGYLHLGTARTALFNYLYARHEGGKFLLRIEDTDQQRSTKAYEESILEGLRWLGLDWDESIVHQSMRFDRYREVASCLESQGRAYRCYCTPDELEKMREQQRKEGLKPRYDGRCRERANAPSSQPFVLRLKTDLTGTTTVNDLICGSVISPNAEMDDLVLLRSDGCPTFHLGVVVDDHNMGITHIIRGDDHLTNTPRQMQIYQALGWEPPVYGHLPMILGPDKTKLSKRHGATALLGYRGMGLPAMALANYLVRLGWSYGDQEVFSSLAELSEKFTLNQVNRKASIFNFDKLLWLGGEHIRMVTPNTLARQWLSWTSSLSSDCALLESNEQPDQVEALGRLLPQDWSVAQYQQQGEPSPWLVQAMSAVRERANTFAEIATALEPFLFTEVVYDQQSVQKHLKPEVKPYLEALLTFIQSRAEMPTEPEIEVFFHQLLEQHAVKMGKVAQPARVALTGKTISPPIYATIALLDQEIAVRRLNKALELIES